MEGNRPRQTPADQRETTFIDLKASPATDAPRRPAADSQRRTAPQPQHRAPAPKRPGRKKKRKTGLIVALCCILCVILLAAAGTLFVLFSEPEDDGLILNNVYAAGVNLGGKSPESAKQVLHEATVNTFAKLDMTVEVHDTIIKLSPADTGAELDIEAVVKAAYEYGRTGSRAERQAARDKSLTTSHTISILPYLNLDTDYIQEQVDELGALYSSTLSQPSHRLEGTRPDLNMDREQIDTEVVYQTLYITMGTAEYGLDVDLLYDRILDAYNTNIFHVVGEMTMVSPEALDIEALHAQFCIAPVDAVLNSETYEVTPEIYGYGFYIDELRQLVSEATYGETVKVDLTFISPKIKEADILDGLFEAIIASYSAPASIDKDLIINLKLACRALDDFVLDPDEEFSFNALVGMPTEESGYKPVLTYVGKSKTEMIGGGISQIASSLYYCALMADLQITERSNHAYAPSFIEPGFDAEVLYGQKDLKFVNTTGRPIRIEARVTEAGALQIDFWGAINDERTVDVVYETVNTYKPSTLYTVMLKDNPDGYEEGDVLIPGATGYDIITYKIYYPTGTEEVTPPPAEGEDSENGENRTAGEKILVALSHYDKQDKVIVTFTAPEKPVDPPETTVPAETEDN